MNIAIIAGELSGDLIGAGVARELTRLAPDIALWGMGAEAMRSAGVEIAIDSAAFSAIGIVDALTKGPAFLATVARAIPKLRVALRDRRPDAVVLIDFGYANIRIARYAKQLGLKVLYYFPPGSWRRKGKVGADLKEVADVVAVPFEWSFARYRDAGVNAVYVGHPILERVVPAMTRSAFAAAFGMDPSLPIIGLLPGSRKREVEQLMPVMLNSAALIHRRVPEAQFVVAVAPSISAEMMEGYLSGHAELRGRLNEIWHEFAHEAESKVLRPITRSAGKLAPSRTPALATPTGVVLPPEALREAAEKRYRRAVATEEKSPPPTVLAKGLTYDVMAHSDVLLVCSGTSTLEATVFATPMVVMYRVSRAREIEYHLRGIRRKVKFIGLPNIAAERMVVPELLQDDASPERIAEHAVAMLNDIETRQRIRTDLRAVRAMLGTPGASERTAALVLELAGRQPGG